MAYTTVEIKSYRLALFSSSESGAKISLDGADGLNFATLFVRPDSETLPAACLDPDGKYRLYFKRSGLRDLVDMLRNEKPVYLHFWTGAGDNSHIATGREPVGEAE